MLCTNVVMARDIQKALEVFCLLFFRVDYFFSSSLFIFSLIEKKKKLGDSNGEKNIFF